MADWLSLLLGILKVNFELKYLSSVIVLNPNPQNHQKKTSEGLKWYYILKGGHLLTALNLI